MLIANAMSLANSQNNGQIEGRRKVLLILLGVWIICVVTLGAVLNIFSNQWYIVSLPAIAVSLLMGYEVYSDFAILEERGDSWDASKVILGVATAVLPPFVLVYLWKRGKSLNR